MEVLPALKKELATHTGGEDEMLVIPVIIIMTINALEIMELLDILLKFKLILY
jgi:hypothetical protein